MLIALLLLICIGPAVILFAFAAVLALAPNATPHGWWILPAIALGILVWAVICKFVGAI
ncbi:hypothetical protein [Celeribacter baekdonensis]|uniref:hypothetical protein n=1 Tax=Celeribacter baekdonensis TaxID=875171 RepID=UPI0030D889CE|tara:strand:- start:33303 stop:33479 length:177 start_codon:yes stop_codon:yes gene_type:complete